jgi:flagellar hook-associated protein 3 FlgL
MKTTFISTSALSEASRLSLMQLQQKLSAAQKEVTTGRLADVGQTLGHRTGQAVSFRYEHARLEAAIATNGIAATRLDATQATLTSMAKEAQFFMGQLIGMRNNPDGQGVMEAQAKRTLSGFIDALNTSTGDSYLFGGINTDVKPVTDYFQSPASSNRQAVENAFITAFGMSQTDPAVETIDATAMQTFLDTTFAALFDEPAWTADWSAASSENVKSRIAVSQIVETSTNANESAIRKLASAYTMVADLGTAGLNEGAYHAVVDTATRLVAEAIQGLTAIQSSLGSAQESIARANERMSIQTDILSSHITQLEGVDPYEASTRVASLMTQLETSYAITARIQKLSILNYL